MSSALLKVVFLTSSYPRHEGDTASVFLRRLAEHLSACEIDVHVLAPADGSGATTLEQKVTVHRFQYLPARMQQLAYGSGMLPNLKRSPSLWLQVPFFMIAMNRALGRLHAKEQFDLIHAPWILPAGLVGWLGSRRSGLPLIVSAHGTDAFGLSRGWQRALKKRVLQSSAAWTANTQSTADALPSASSVDPPHIFPMGVDLVHFSSGSRTFHRAGLSTGEFLLVFVGRLIENKGCHDLLRAFALLEPKTRSATKLWIVGDGDQRRELEQLSESLGVNDAVRFTCAVPQTQLPDLYAAADLVVIPSRPGSAGEQEGQSVVVLEAFAARACVLATRCGGIPGIVEDGVTGMLVEPGNPEAVARGIENLLNRPDLRARLAETAFSRLRGKYDWQTVAEAFSGLYREVAARYRSQSRR